MFYYHHRYHGMPCDCLYMARNPMAFGLGLYPPDYKNLTKVKQDLARIAREFDLVLITEYFDESLILLKKALCWKFEDILYVKMRERLKTRKEEISNRTKEQILKWNSADWMIYDFFNRTLWRKIQEYGPGFWKDLRLFRGMNAQAHKFCLHDNFTKIIKTRIIRKYQVDGNPWKDVRQRHLCTTLIDHDTLPYFRLKFQPVNDGQSSQEIMRKLGLSERGAEEKLNFTDPL